VNAAIYLNNAATGFPKSQRVIDRIHRMLGSPPFDPARSGFSQDYEDVVSATRNVLAEMFNVKDPGRICFSSGATESLNIALFGLGLDGTHVVTTVMEHNSVLRPLKTMERDDHISLTIVPCNEAGCITAHSIENALRPDTAAVVVNHCSNVTGVVNDIEDIGTCLHGYGIPFIVDASQSAGTYAIDVQNMYIDMLVFAGHKSLGGIPGIGGAYINDTIRPAALKIGGTGVRSDYLYQPETVPMYYEAGTQNICGIASLYEGVAAINEMGLDVIRTRKETMVARMQNALCRYAGVRCIPGREYPQSTTLFSFTVDEMEPADISYILEKSFDIITRAGLHCAPLIHKHIGTFPEGTVRISPSERTDETQITIFLEAMDTILKKG
jgi:cysteine desulfurase family protein